MKKIVLSCIVFLLAGLVFPISVLGSYDVKYTCLNNVCIEGDTANFELWYAWDTPQTAADITIDSIELTEVSLKDKQYDTLIARKDLSKLLKYNTPITISLTGIIPPPTKGHTFYYVPCFEETIKYHTFILNERFDRTTTSSSCGKDTLTMNVYPLSEIECRHDVYCRDDESCLNFKCVKLACEDYQSYEFHQCKNLVCKFYQKASNHRCGNNYLIISLIAIGLLFLIVLVIVNMRRKSQVHKKGKNGAKNKGDAK